MTKNLLHTGFLILPITLVAMSFVMSAIKGPFALGRTGGANHPVAVL